MALGTLAFLVAILPPLDDAPPLELAVYFGVLLTAWIAALQRRLDYRLRAGLLLRSSVLEVEKGERVHAGTA